MENVKVQKLNFEAPSGNISASLRSLENSSDQLAVVLPGAGYSCRMPLLYYSIDVLLMKGFQVLAIEKIYAEDTTWLGFKMRESAFQYVKNDSVILFNQISKQFSNCVQVLLGRSLGTYQIACVMEKSIVRPKQIVWQTPSLYEKWPVIKNCGVSGFGIIGTADQRYQDAISFFPEDRIVIDGADHSMEAPGDPLKSILHLENAIAATDKWLIRA